MGRPLVCRESMRPLVCALWCGPSGVRPLPLPDAPNPFHSTLGTPKGGGVFGNPIEWIADAVREACEEFRGHHLDVRLVCYGGVGRDIQALVDDFEKGPANTGRT